MAIGSRFVGAGAYGWTPNWSSRADVVFVHSRKNETRDAFGNPVYRALQLQLESVSRERLAGELQIRSGMVDWPDARVHAHRDRNYYDPSTFFYSPAKLRYAAGVSGEYPLSPTHSLNAKVEAVRTREFVNPGPPPFTPVTIAQRGRRSSPCSVQPSTSD